MKLKELFDLSETKIKIANGIELEIETGIVTITQGEHKIILTKTSAKKLCDVLSKNI